MIFDVNCHFGADASLPAHYSEPKLTALLKSAGIDMAISTELRKDTFTAFPRGIRLYPTYRPLDWNGPEGSALIIQGWDKKLALQVFLRLQDPRVLPQVVSSAQVIEALGEVTGAHKNVKYIISGATYAEANANRELFTRENVWMDIAHVQHPTNSLEKLIGAIGSDRILFGSNAPIFYPYANVFRVMESKISDEDREKILWRNAAELFQRADFSVR